MTPTKSQQSQDSSNQDKVDTIAQILVLRIEDILTELELNVIKSGKMFVGACPIHGGKKKSSLNLYPEGHTVPCYWQCRSHECHKIFKPTIIGFIRGVLSNRKYGWEKQGDKMLSFADTIDWCCKFIGQGINEIKIDKAELERRRFANQTKSLTKNVNVKHEGIHRNLVRNNLQIPADFFVQRKYSPEILDKYDVGLCDKQGKDMSGRVVVPIYDDTKNYMIGCTGRSIYPICPKCNCYHNANTNCPAEEQRWMYSKWKHNFNAGSCLYNYWNAKKYIQESGAVILVEGPADVWRLEENGIHNAVAIFGCELTEEQQILLESSGAMSLVLLLDNDEPGRIGVKNIKQSLERFYNIYIPKYTAHDVGEMTPKLIEEELLPTLQSIYIKNKITSF